MSLISWEKRFIPEAKMPKKIAIIATLDTKGEETQYVKTLIEKRGHVPLVIDCGIRGKPYFEPSISRQAVAAAAETTVDEIIARQDKNYAIRTMTEGTKAIALELYRAGNLDGIFALGGVQGTIIGTTVMRALPFGVPKVMVQPLPTDRRPSVRLQAPKTLP